MKKNKKQLAGRVDWLAIGLNYASYMPNYNGQSLYHYTSPQGFQSILFQNDRATLWASRYDCMNDTSEGKVVDEVYKQVCQELFNNGEIGQEQYELIRDIKQYNSAPFFYPAVNVYTHGKPLGGSYHFLSCDRYLCCFSQNNDSLAMWNYYTKNDKHEGYNIEFDGAELESFLSTLRDKDAYIVLSPVLYTAAEQKVYVKKFLKDIMPTPYSAEEDKETIKIAIAEQLFDWSLVFKNKQFEQEEEIRLIIHIPKEPPKNKQEGFTIKHRFNKGISIPYIELGVEQNCITQVNIAPVQHDNTEKEKQKLEEALAQKGYQNVLVDYSKVPIRF